MLRIEYDKRSLKALFDGKDTFKDSATLKQFVSILKGLIPSSKRKYNPETNVWFFPEAYIQLLRDRTNHLDVSWEKRI